MVKLGVLVMVCLVGNMAVSVTSVLDKPYYELENADGLFHDFVKQYGKSYSREEYFERLEIFRERLKVINRRNARFPHTVFAVNRFTDLKPEELQQYRGFKPSNVTRVKVSIIDDSVDPPAQFDWREKGVVSHVKDQGFCGSCYIFSAVGNIEGQYALKHNECLAFSEGQALDCFNRETCHGGLAHWVMDDFGKSKGLMKEEDYAYTPMKHKCHQDPKKVFGHVKEGQVLDIPDEDTLLKTLVKIGPLAVSLKVGSEILQYSGGIVYPDECIDLEPDHAVVLVGYGEEKGLPYWIIKNSWGDDWGDKGYFRLLRGVNACQMGTSYTANAIMV